jgi:hypothetical protein
MHSHPPASETHANSRQFQLPKQEQAVQHKTQQTTLRIRQQLVSQPLTAEILCLQKTANSTSNGGPTSTAHSAATAIPQVG